MRGLLQDKVAIVTGGTSGIGRATVEQYIDEGAKVVIADIQDDQGQELAHRLGESALYVHTDVTQEHDLKTVVNSTTEHFGRLDIFFNNAGAKGDPSSMTDLSAEGFDKAIALLTRSVLLGHKYAARQFKEQGDGGAIISTASAAGLQGGWSTTAYTVAKHAVVGLVRQAVVELAPFQIRSNAIAPGIIMTPIMARSFGVPMEQAEDFASFLADRLGPQQPYGRVGFAEDVASVATFLACDLSQYVTGAVIPVDGGATAITQGSFARDVVEAANEYNERKLPLSR